jgi:hypothetical protein
VDIIGSKLVILNRSAIQADANAGQGGNINIQTDTIVQSADSIITATSQSNVDGQVRIDTVNNLIAEVVDIEAAIIDEPEPIRQACTPRQIENRSSLIVDQVPRDAVRSEYLSGMVGGPATGALVACAP